MNNSLGLSLSWDSSAAGTFPGSISCPKPNLPESGIFSFLHISTTLCMLLPEQFLPFLVVIMKTPHFSRDLCAPWGWRLYSNWRFKYWSEHHATETMRNLFMYQHVTPSYIVYCTPMNYLWKYSGNTDYQIGRGPEWLRERCRKRLFLRFLLCLLNLSHTYVLLSQKIYSKY